MFNLLKRKNFSFSKISSAILNSKLTYIFLILIILIQFILVSIIFLQNRKYKYLIEQTNFKVGSIESQQRIMDEKLNGLSANIMRMSAQLYRIQAGVK